VARWQDRAEEWIYALNERDHWIFRLYDAFNEAWAPLGFPGVQRRAAADWGAPVPRGSGVSVRRLVLADLDAFAQLLAGYDVRYTPPHGLGRADAERALQRRSYVPLGIFERGELVGYVLLRLFFPRRGVSGIWIRSGHHGAGLGRAGFGASTLLAKHCGLVNFCTVPIDNPNSLRLAQSAGFRILRTNRRFHVLRALPAEARDPAAEAVAAEADAASGGAE
jgi:hypothetical protein